MRCSGRLLEARRVAALSAALVVALSACAAASRSPGISRPSAGGRSVTVAQPRAFLYLVSPSGGNPRPLFSPAEAASLVSVSDPEWSPDGRQIAFAAGCPTCSPKLYVASSTGRDLRMIPTGPGRVLSPGWAPNGQAIAFARERGEQQFIVTVNLKSDRVRLINGEPEGADNTDSTPAWSPDGRTIVFGRELHHEDVTLWQVPADGGARQPLIRGNRAFDQTHPRWSPDGRRVVFMQAVPPSATWHLFVLHVATR